MEIPGNRPGNRLRSSRLQNHGNSGVEFPTSGVVRARRLLFIVVKDILSDMVERAQSEDQMQVQSSKLPNYYLTPKVNQHTITTRVADRRADDLAGLLVRTSNSTDGCGLQYTGATRVYSTHKLCNQVVGSLGGRAAPAQSYGDAYAWLSRIDRMGDFLAVGPPRNRDALPPAQTGVAHGRGILSSAER